MTTVRRLLTSVLLLAAVLRGQDQATTLLANLRGADVVVRARVLAATDPSPEFHRLQFATTLVVKGDAPAAFALLEPAGACCGRSLFALVPGDDRLLFLRRTGPSWHPLGGSRGVVPVSDELLAHVIALHAAGNGPQLAALLARGLANAEPRVADDAAHALATLPTLALPPAERELVTTALQQALTLRTARAASLVDATVRLGDIGALETMLGLYLDTPHADHGALLRNGLRRCDEAPVLARLPQWLGHASRGPRAAELLVALPSPAAAAAVHDLVQRSPDPRVQLCLTEALLSNGVDARALAARVPAPVLQLARERAERPRPYRAIAPGRR